MVAIDDFYVAFNLQEIIKSSCESIMLLGEYMMAMTYLTTKELSERIKYDDRTIREQLKDSVLFEGVHYVRPFGGRKILFLWERVEEEMLNGMTIDSLITGL